MNNLSSSSSVRPLCALATLAIAPLVFVVACTINPAPSGGHNGSGGGGGTTGGGPTATATATSTADLCYGPFDCNGNTVDKQCFSNQTDYCDSLCSEDNCVAQIFCQNECN